jgi:hypothetical protein
MRESNMSWRRGAGTVEVELANCQSKIESWSGELDGENGVISIVRTQVAEHEATQRLIKGALWVGGLFVGLPAFLVSGIELYKLIAGR